MKTLLFATSIWFTAAAASTAVATAVGLSAVPQEVMDKFEQFLSDPRGAEIEISVDKNLVTESGSERIVCGKFNSKNAYGAFVGFKPFVFRSSGGGRLFYDGVAVESDGSVKSVWTLMQSNPETNDEINAIDRQAKVILFNVSQSLTLCKVASQ